MKPDKYTKITKEGEMEQDDLMAAIKSGKVMIENYGTGYLKIDVDFEEKDKVNVEGVSWDGSEWNFQVKNIINVIESLTENDLDVILSPHSTRKFIQVVQNQKGGE